MSKHPATRTPRRKRRSAPGAGRLYKRGPGGREYPPESPTNSPFWLAYTVNGERVRQPLKDANGEPITDRDTAEAERRRILAPYQTGDKAETLKAIVARLDNAEADHARAVEDANPPLRIADAWNTYATAPGRPDSGELTLTRYAGHWERFAAWLAKAHPAAEFLRDVTPAIAGEYAADLAAAAYGPNSFNKHVGFLKLLFRVLADAARIAGNPFAKVTRKTLRTHSRRELTIAELTAILDRADGDLALLLYLGATTGLRLGDCATLTWGDVDLARGLIRRIPNKTAKKGIPVRVGIPVALHDRLAAIPPAKRTGYVLPGMAEDYRRNPPAITNAVKALVLDCGIDVHAPGTGERIKRQPDGTPARNPATGKVIVESTGKPAAVDVGFHSLRHTWVSMHAARGTPQGVIQASVGHSNPAMTQHYLHVSEATARDVALALPAFTANGGAPDAHREPLPAWARALVETLTDGNAKTIRAELLKEGAA